MPATVVSVLILIVSGILLFFWLQLASRSIRAQGFERNFGADVAQANQLQYLEIQRALSGEPEVIADYKEVLATLEWDYKALTYLLRNAATLHVGRYSSAERLLILDFQLLRLGVRVKRLLGIGDWQSSLRGMVSILDYFGNVVGQRLATFTGSLPARS